MDQKHENLISSIDNLIELSEKKIDALRELRKSYLMMAIWPHAFDHNRCGMGGKQDGMAEAFVYAYLDNGKEKHYLSRDELLLLKPEAKIHRTFRQAALPARSS